MRIRLESQWRQLAFAAACALACGMLAGHAARAGLAAYSAGLNTVESMRYAAQLQPRNAGYHSLLGRYYALAPEQDLAQADGQYESAVALNPYDARVWLELA